MEKNNEPLKIVRPTEFSQDAYLKRRKEYIDNMENYLNKKEAKDENKNNGQTE